MRSSECLRTLNTEGSHAGWHRNSLCSINLLYDNKLWIESRVLIRYRLNWRSTQQVIKNEGESNVPNFTVIDETVNLQGTAFCHKLHVIDKKIAMIWNGFLFYFILFYHWVDFKLVKVTHNHTSRQQNQILKICAHPQNHIDYILLLMTAHHVTKHAIHRAQLENKSVKVLLLWTLQKLAWLPAKFYILLSY